MKKTKIKTSYKTGERVKPSSKKPTTFSFPELDKLMAKKKKIEEEIKIKRRKRFIRGRPSTVTRGGGQYVKKGGKV